MSSQATRATAHADNATQWCQQFFNDVFAAAHLVRQDAGAMAQTVRFLKQALHLQSGMRVFDQCCGVGDVSLALAAEGLQVMGVDLMPSYIDTARQRAADAGQTADFYAADAGAFVPPQLCDAALNWWTSFGYSASDTENIQMLHRAFESLKPGGYFALDYMNAPQRCAAFAGKDVVVDRYTLPDGAVSVWESRLIESGRMLQRTWHYTDTMGKTLTQQGAGAKLYTAVQLQELLETAGFVNVCFYGSDAGDIYDAQSPRCIAVACKPEV